jgi:hypothetical protein
MGRARHNASGVTGSFAENRAILGKLEGDQMGRPTSWTPVRVKQAVELGLEGLGPAEIARRVGVTPGRVSALFSRLRTAGQSPAPVPGRAPRGRKPSSWDDPWRRDRVFELFGKGVACSAIARQLGTTKNAVIGLVARARDRGELAQWLAEVAGEEPPTLLERLRWDVVMVGGCRWIFGHPRPEPGEPVDWSWCGAPLLRGLPYCPRHAALAYRRAGEPVA